MDIRERITREAAKYGFGVSAKQLVNLIFAKLRYEGFELSLLNARYLITPDGRKFKFAKSTVKGYWIVKEY